jgi:hypothetical protein
MLARGLTSADVGQPLSVGIWLTQNIKNYDGASGSITLNSDCEGSRAVSIQQVQDGKFVKYGE